MVEREALVWFVETSSSGWSCMKRVKRSKISWSQPLFHAYLEEGTAIFFLCSWYQSSWIIVSKEAQSYWLGLMASPRQPRRCWVLCAAWPFPGAELFLSRPQEEPWAHQELWGSQFVVPRFQPKPAPFRWLVVVKKQQQWGRLRIKGEKWD